MVLKSSQMPIWKSNLWILPAELYSKYSYTLGMGTWFALPLYCRKMINQNQIVLDGDEYLEKNKG